MNDLTDQQLLGDFADRGAEEVFTELVRRYVNLVYSTALRIVQDAQLAEDVTQTVFVALSQNARQLADHPFFVSWLHRTTRNLAANAVRSDARRRTREQEAALMNELLSAEPEVLWKDIAPNLDNALDELNEPDRAAILLRFFEGKSMQEMANTLDITNGAAQRRVSRAVERLRKLFVKSGVSVGTSGLVALVSANAVQAAPVGLITTISTASAVGGTSLITSAIATTTKAAAMTTLQKTVATTALVAVIGTPLAVQQHTLSDLRAENEQLVQAAERVDTLQEQRDALAYRDSLARELARLQENHEELLRLREETSALNSAEIAEKAQMSRRIEELQQEADRINYEAELLANEGRIKTQIVNEMKQLGLSARIYSTEHEDILPSSFEMILEDENLSEGLSEAVSDLSKYEFYPHEVPVQEWQPRAILFREIEPRQLRSGEWSRAYTFADGSVQSATSPTPDFSEWERINSDLEAGKATRNP